MVRSTFALLLLLACASTVEAQPGPARWSASAEEIGWVRRNAIPLRTDAPGSGTADLERLHPLVDGTRVVGLGEGTHGTREFFRVRHRMVEWLAAREGFTVLAVESGMAEARAVNEYVLTGRGDPRAALAGTHFWTINTQEMLELVEWMRAYNASGRGRIEFWGVDMQLPNVAVDSVRAFVARAEPSYLPVLDSAYAAAREVWRMRAGRADTARARWMYEAPARVLAHLEASRATYRGMDTLQVAWAIQNARIARQTTDHIRVNRSVAVRDRAMAENLEWILAHQPAGARAILWAHNDHVGRNAPYLMGGLLSSRMGDAYRAFGFVFGEGTYTAVGTAGLAAHSVPPPPPGSIEQALRDTGIPRFVVDLRRAAADPDGKWLAEHHPIRIFGARVTETPLRERSPARYLDALVYLDHTQASVPLPMQP